MTGPYLHVPNKIPAVSPQFFANLGEQLVRVRAAQARNGTLLPANGRRGD